MSGSATPPIIALQGDFDHGDFFELRTFVGNPRSGANPDIIACCQSRPGQLSQAAIEQIYAASPLAHLLLVLGSWCEGEQRSGYPIHGVERVYWYEAVPRLKQLGHSTRTPRTTTPAERIQQQCRQLPQTSGNAIVVARSRLERQCLADTCTTIGLATMATHWNTATAPSESVEVHAVLIAADDLGVPELRRNLTRLRPFYPRAKIVAALNFPRRDEVMQLQAIGCDHILGKPVYLADLAAIFSRPLPAGLPKP